MNNAWDHNPPSHLEYLLERGEFNQARELLREHFHATNSSIWEDTVYPRTILEARNATSIEKLAMLDDLLGYGFPLDPTHQSHSLLEQVIISQPLEIIEGLIARGASTIPKGGKPCSLGGLLTSALENPDPRVAVALIEGGYPLDTQEGYFSHTPAFLCVSHAIGSKSAIILETLFKKGCSPNEKNAEGTSLLQEACSQRRPETVECLVRHGAQINIHDPFGNFPLGSAAANWDTKSVKILIEAGADVFMRQGSDGQTLWEITDSEEIHELLNEARAQREAQDLSISTSSVLLSRRTARL